MWYNRLILLFLIAFSITIMGCSQEEDSASPRTQSYVLTATQDARNVLKYQFKVTHQGRELTSSDASFLWNFGDAAGTSTEAAPAYEYVEKGERKVSVSIIMNSDENGVSERVSQDTIILVGEQSSIHDSIITAYAGEGTELLKYKLISSAIASEETGGALNYLWKVTGPDGENGAIKTTTYPQEGEEPITTNTINHTFKKYGYNYNIDLYIKSADAAEYDMSSPTANLYLTTALPTISISCKSIGKQDNLEKVRCEPNFEYEGIKYGMQYKWTFYSADGSSTVKDGEATSTGDKPEVEFSYSTAGTKLITIEGTHPTNMIGTAKGSVTVVLSSAGILNPITCYRPTDNLGNFTDKTKLEYVCEAQGYYNNRNNLDVPLPLTSYTWKITEDGNNYQADSYSWSENTDDVVGVDKNYGTANPVITRVDCDEAKNICTTTLKFTADKYGAQYQVSLSATQLDQDNTQQTHTLNTSDVLVNVEMPKITGITRTTSEANPMQSVFTPTYDTEIPTSKTLNYYWSIQGTKTAASTSTTDTWYESAGGNKQYDGTWAVTDRTLTHTFSQSADYAIVLRIASEFFSNGKSGAEHGTVDMPSLTGNEHLLNFELNQSIAGSYFTFSINNITNQVRFFTDYEARVGGQPVDTTYVFTITGPTYTNPDRPNQANKVVLHNKKEFETITPKPDDIVGTVTNNVRLIYGATYTVQLEVWNKAVYDSNRTNGKVENATYKLVNLTSGATGDSQFTTKSLTIEKGLKPDMKTHWWETLTPKIYYTEGTTDYNIDLSMFTCSVALTDPNNIMRVGTTIPFDYNSATNTITTDCNNVFYLNGNGANQSGTLTGTLTITGPLLENNAFIRKELPISITYSYQAH